MKHLNRLLTLLIAASVIFMSGCGKAPDDQESKSPSIHQENINFRLKWLIYSSFAPHFVAVEKGYHEENGLKVTINPGGPGLDPIRLIASGSDLVGLASYDQILAAREKGIPVIAIAEDTTKSGVGFMSLKESNIKKPEDFIGRKVGVMPGTDKGTMYEALMSKVGIDRSKIEEIPIGFNLILLFEKKIEVFPAFISNQPIVAKNKGFEVNIVDPYEYGVRPGGNVYFTSEEKLKSNRDVLKRFLKGEMKAIAVSQKMPDGDVVDMVMKYNPKLNKQTEIEIWQATKPMLLQSDTSLIGKMSPATWKHTAEIALNYGLLKKKADIESCFTNELVEEIHSEGFTDEVLAEISQSK
ncbi:MAG: ABC transporter substrate-binding protein [Kiritimatiellae bacterium]|jgi:NitT/TauT family transport system substrate-binding protein|nr:ABC transporter substrate-binding protein [Kiritimatiellia bacterium]